MTRLSQIAAALLAAWIAGCAAPPVDPSAVVISRRAAVVAPEARGAIVPGRSTRADVQRALGETLAISFENGCEVWVYRVSDAGIRRSAAPGANAELVVLFDPSGIAAKTRLRPAPAR